MAYWKKNKVKIKWINKTVVGHTGTIPRNVMSNVGKLKNWLNSHRKLVKIRVPSNRNFVYKVK